MPPATPATGTAPTAPVAPPVAPKKGVNVLIVALDDDSAIVTTNPAGEVPFTAAPPNSTITPDVPLTGVTPTRFEGLHPVWQTWAKKTKKPETPLYPFPEPPNNVAPFPGSIVGPGTVVVPTDPRSTLPGAPTNQIPPLLLPARPTTVAGRSLLAALPLARALNGIGYGDAQATGTDGSILVRAVGEKRLSPEMVLALREAMKSLESAAKLPEALRQTSIKVATSRANNAATAIGQATGYRAVVAIYVAPFADGASSYALVVSDSAKEVGEPILWSETARDEETARATGATTGAALIDRELTNWVPAGQSNPKALAEMHLAKAKAAPDLATAKDELTRAIALDPTRADAFILLGDLLAPTDLVGSANAYRRAVEINSKDGATYEKIAIAYANATIPDWPRALDAGQKALAAGTDSANLRIAMARAQFGRADLFRAANRAYRADDAEAEAQTHIERALQLAPGNADALRLLARSLLASGRTSEAVQTLSRVTTMFPKDAELQLQYAQALITLGDRKGDAFAAYARLWKMTANTNPTVDEITYSSLTEGFDERVYALGKSANQLSDSVAAGNTARESGFLQLTRLKSDMGDAEMAINALQPPNGFSSTAATARQFAASLMNQALENHQTFLDTGQDVYRVRARDLYKQAVSQLNSARGAN